MRNAQSGSRPLGMMNTLLAFALSAAMGVAFVILVFKTHDLFSSAAFTAGVPNVAVLKAQIVLNVRYLASQI